MQREKEIHEIEIHVAALCINQEGTDENILIGKRADDRLIFPGYWECGGGQVHIGETLEEAVKFHMQEEFGLEVNVLFPFATYSIELKDKLIPGIRFVCNPVAGSLVNIDYEEIVDYRWININELKKYDLIPGLCDDIVTGYNFYAKLAGLICNDSNKDNVQLAPRPA